MKPTYFTILFFALLATACKQKVIKPVYLRDNIEVDNIAGIENRFDHFKQQVVGHFSNKEQLENYSIDEKEQELIIIPIFKDRPDEFWVYVELFSPSLVDQPIEQRVQRFRKVERDTILVEVYYLPQPEEYINEWKKDKPFENLEKKDLVRDNGCDMIIACKDPSNHIYRTLPSQDITCHLGTRNTIAEYMDISFALTDEGYLMRFKYYDKSKKLLRESNYSGLYFERLDYQHEDYVNRANSKQ
ncbi:MAG: chromophore lyase CpcT/CpeT [Saprospiraceae bacterium]|nr:chromophore lyase CpcT/CpeT [Saprospiraceae bacterium]